MSAPDMTAPSPLHLAPRPPRVPVPSVSGPAFKHPRLPGVTLTPTSADIVLGLNTDSVQAVAHLTASSARSLASALYAFAELLEPKRESRGSGWTPS